MIHRSSIFSFSTLRVRPWLPKPLLLAIVLIAVAELIARYAVHAHRLDLDPSVRRLIDEHRSEIANRPADVWLLGNSTLDWGIDDKVLDQAGLKYVKLPHGSATVAASALMLDSYLQSAPKLPRKIILFLSEDDLNLNGSRAKVSKEYVTLFQNRFGSPEEHLMLWRCRAHILDRLKSTLDRILHQAPYKPRDNQHPTFDGKILLDDDYYVQLVQNYAIDDKAVAAFADTARRHGVSDVRLVLVPCTDVYARFHTIKVPGMPYDALRADISRMCTAARVVFFDLGTPSKAYDEFRDGYHLNPVGATRFTKVLLAKQILQ